jgi:hypothetical protein
VEACGAQVVQRGRPSPVEVETFLLEVDRGALGGIDSEAAAEFQLADRLQGLVDVAGCVGSCFVAGPATRPRLPVLIIAGSKEKSQPPPESSPRHLMLRGTGGLARCL